MVCPEVHARKGSMSMNYRVLTLPERSWRIAVGFSALS